MQIEVRSLISTAEERAKWPSRKAICPRCGKKFSSAKMVRDKSPGGHKIVVHKRCSDGSYLKNY